MAWTYAECERQFNRRAKGRDFKRVFANDELRKDGDDYVFVFNYWRQEGSEIARVRPDNTVVLRLPKGGYNPSVQNRMYDIAGVQVGSDVSGHKLKEVSVRIRGRNEYGVWMKDSLPFIDGVVVHTVSERILNPELLVDKVRTTDPDKRLEIQRKVRAWAKLMRVMAKMGMYDKDAYQTWYKEATVKKDGRWITPVTFDFADLDNPTTEVANYMFHQHTREYWDLRGEPGAKMKDDRRRADLTLRKFTEYLYKKHDCYTFKEISNDATPPALHNGTDG